jgi:hypothetical protein
MANTKSKSKPAPKATPAKSVKTPAKTVAAPPPKKTVSRKKHSQLFIHVKTFLEENGHSKAVQAWEEHESALNKFVKAQERKTESKKAKDPNAPKKPKSAYMIFCQENRDKIKAKNEGIATTEIMKKLGDEWRAIKDNEKKVKPYVALAAKEKEKYNKEMENYTPPPGFAKKKAQKQKKAPTSYILFCKDIRPTLKEEGFAPKDILKESGRKWTELKKDNVEEFKRYQKLAEEAKKKFEEENGITPAPKKATAPAKKGKAPEKKTQVVVESEESEDEEDEIEDSEEIEDDDE